MSLLFRFSLVSGLYTLLLFAPCASQAAVAPVVGFRIEPQQASVAVGQQVRVDVYAQDHRATPTGIFSAFLDLTYSADYLEIVPGSVSFGHEFGESATAGTATPGLLDEIGSFARALSTPGAPFESLFFSVWLLGKAPGTASILTDPADTLPLHATTMEGLLDGVPNANIEFGGTSLLVVVPEPASFGLLGVAAIILGFGAKRRAR